MAFNPGPGGGGGGSIAGSSDVSLSSLQNDQVLTYDSGSSKWENKALPASGGGVNDPEVYQLPAPNGSNDTAAINAAMDGLNYNRTRIVLFQSGTYLTTGVTIPWPMSVVFRGVGTGHDGGMAGTRIKRTGSGTGPVINATGDPSTLSSSQVSKPEYRVRFDIHDIEIDANGSGVALNSFRGSENIFENIRCVNAPRGGLILSQHFNARAEGVHIANCGTGTTYPALIVTGTGNEGTPGGTNTVHLTDFDLKDNTGIDFKITCGATSAASVGIMVSQIKIERQTGDYPQIELTSGAEIQIINSYLFLGSGSTTTPQIRVAGGRFIAAGLNVRREGSNTGHIIYQTSASSLVNLAGVYIDSSPSEAAIRVGSDVAPHRLRVSAASMLPAQEQADKLIRDDRSNGGSYTYP